MTAEFHRKIIEIQKAVRQRELHRLELERELMLSARRKERNYDRLCSRLQALKLELLQDEQATNRRIDGLIARVGALEKEYEATIKKTLELKAKKKQFQLRRSLSNILRSPINNQMSIPGRTSYDPVGFDAMKVNKETQTDFGTFCVHDVHGNQQSTSQNERENQPQRSLNGRLKNQRRSSDSFLHHRGPLLQNYTPAFSSSFDKIETDILDDSFYSGRYEKHSRRERTKSLGPENAPSLSYISKNYGLEGFENTFQISSNTNNRNREYQNIHNESLNEDDLPNLYTQANNSHSKTNQTISEEPKDENSLLSYQPKNTNPNKEDDDFNVIKPNISSGDDRMTASSNVNTDQINEQQGQRQILSSNATNFSENSSSSQDLNSNKEVTKPKALKLVSFSSPNQNKSNTKSHHEDKANNTTVESKNPNIEAIISIKNSVLPTEVIQTSERPEKTNTTADEGNNLVNDIDAFSETSKQMPKAQLEIITIPEKPIETVEINNETSSKGSDFHYKTTVSQMKSIDTPKKVAETTPSKSIDTLKKVNEVPLKSYDAPNKVAETQFTERSNKTTETKIHSEHSVTNESSQSSSATKETLSQILSPHSKETSNIDINPKDSKDPKYSKDNRVENSMDNIQSPIGSKNQLNSSSLKKEEAKIIFTERENEEDRKDFNTLNAITQKKKPLNDDMDFFDEEIPIKETSAYQRMLGVLPGMGYQPTSTNDKRSQNSPKASTRIASRWGAPPEGSEGGTRPSDTESIDSVEAAIQASMSAKKVSPTRNHNIESSPEPQPLTPAKSSPETPISKTNLGAGKLSAKTPIKLNLDSESESYSMSAGGVSEEDDFEF